MRRLTSRRKGTDLERFESKLSYEPNTGCWFWIGATTGRYGSFFFPDYPVKYPWGNVAAHKAALYFYKGIVVERPLEVLHSCDNGFCCNPDHLSVGTHQDNMRDMASKDRHVIPTQVLSEDDINVARMLRGQGWQVKDIAIKFGISSSQMSRVVKGCQPKFRRKCKVEDKNE